MNPLILIQGVFSGILAALLIVFGIGLGTSGGFLQGLSTYLVLAGAGLGAVTAWTLACLYSKSKVGLIGVAIISVSYLVLGATLLPFGSLLILAGIFGFGGMADRQWRSSLC